MGRAVGEGEAVTIGVAAERWEPYESRGSRTVLRGPGGEIPLGYSLDLCAASMRLSNFRFHSACTLG
jgi:hypothetical protein